MIRTALFALALAASLVAGLVTAAEAEDPFFELGALNAGLDDPPDRIDRRTPRAAIVSLLRAAKDGDWAAAAHLLELTDIPEAEQSVTGPVLAAQLHAIIDRKALLDWGRLNARPDALQITGGKTDAQAGEPRRSLLLRELPLDYAPASVRLNRIKAGDADPVWVFPRETVADLPDLYRVYGPSRLEKLLPAPMRDDAFWGLMWWELIGVPLLLVAAGMLAWALHRSLRAIGRHATHPMTAAIFRAVRTPVMVAGVTTLVWYVTRHVFVFSGNIDILISPLIAIGFVTALLMLIVNVVEVALDTLIAPGEDVDLTRAEQAESRTLATRLNAAKRILVVVVFFIGAGVVLSTANFFQGIGLSLLASAGALTLILGFAARDVLGNIMASLQIALNQSARVGDRVVYKGELCHVERIHLTFVQLRDWDGTRLVVPVEEFVSETFSNWSLQDPAMLRILKFKLDPRADIDALREAFREILEEVSASDLGAQLGDLEDASVNVAGQDVFGIDVWFSTPCTDPNTSWEVACTVRERLVARATEIEKSREDPIFPTAVAADAAA
ncbi:mechanosensitive ion channel family protein [Jannaschia sp. S6380]|uniref:mechanosensitive ion channel family protein n=1 Tax=Jannaschia sp. S6380 TaxID=2926408 RepID=UPI001FF255D7|nr:mechanosensitive ion channel domain-containing protein [Jannaschia sp. S6380]MCK0167037.1 mechanosensitive ion channel family protein [Jannaschia sp. S6380]